MKRLILSLSVAILTYGCIEKPDFATDQVVPAEVALSKVVFPKDFNFETSQQVSLTIIDNNQTGIYSVSYELDEDSYQIGTFVQQENGLVTEITLPTAVDEIQVIKQTASTNISYTVKVISNQANLEIPLYLSSNISSGCIDHLYAVNNNGDFFTIDVSSLDFQKTDFPNLQGGGSIANALDQQNGIMYYNVNETLYAYDIENGTFSVKHNGNPFGRSYPRLEFKDGFFYMSNGNKMYKVNVDSNEIIAEYNISGFINSTSGGDLAFDSNGDLYLACFSGLYKFTSINDGNGTASIIRISAENFPFQLTSMAIDRQDRIFVGTNDVNSRLIEISKEDGAYSIVKIFDQKINDLTAWKCDTTELSQVDSDNDGVIDELDDYPFDPEAATDIYTPSQLGMGSFAFEDLWPMKGDYDFNDMVISYRYTNVLNSSNNVVRLKMELVLRAVGAGQRSGFGIELNVNPSKIESVSGHSTAGNNTTLNAKGLEAGQNKAVLIVFNDTHNHVQPASGSKFVNTDLGETLVPNKTFNLVIEFTEPISQSEVGDAPFNPFIFSSNDRGKEVHLSGKSPTALADNGLFGTGEDDTNFSLGKTYMTENNHPWAIHIIHNFRYPIEKARIDEGYNKFTEWAQSKGAVYKDWYGDNNGYRNTGKLFFNN